MYYSLISSMNKSAGYTARTTAFASATAITDTTILNALNTFDLGLISNGLDTKMKAVYPMVGGTSTTCKYNFMNAVDSNSAFRLQFFGGGTFSANGYQPNGTNAYANTFLSPSANLTLNSGHISYYSRTNELRTEHNIGSESGGVGTTLLRITGTSYFKVNTAGAYVTYADSNSQAFYMSNRTASTVYNGWRNSTKVGQDTASPVGLVNTSFYLSTLNQDNVPIYYSNKQCAFSSIGTGLTDGEAVIFYNLIQAMQTTLARQI